MLKHLTHSLVGSWISKTPAWVWFGLILLAIEVGLAATAPWLRQETWASRRILCLFVGVHMFAGAVYLVTLQLQHGMNAGPKALSAIFVIGLGMRLTLVASTPVLETDYFRYLWDGGLVAHGISPYRLSPQEVKEALAGQGEIDPRVLALAKDAGITIDWISHAEVKTIYPPVAQAMFALAHWISPWNVTAWRWLLLAFDTAAVFLLLATLRTLKLPLAWIAVYWWNPLFPKEFYSGAHLDVILCPLVAGAIFAAVRKRPFAAAALLALATGVKFWPVVLIPVVLRPLYGEFKQLVVGLAIYGTLTALCLLPMYLAGNGGVSGAETYARSWENNDAVFRSIVWAWQTALHWIRIPEYHAQYAARLTVTLLLVAWLILLVRRPFERPLHMVRASMMAVAGVFLLSPTQFPWYYTWLLPLLVLAPNWGCVTLPAAQLLR